MIRIISVVPIARGVGKETLTYFTARDAREGMLISVPLRSRKIPALILASKEAALGKADIKAADFALKRAGESRGHVLSPAFVRAAARTARFFAAHTGAVVEALTPAAILEGAPTAPKTAPPATGGQAEKLLFQADEAERDAFYKSFIREEFAKKHSLFLAVPTVRDAERLHALLCRGIEEHVFLFHSEFGKKEIIARWKKAVRHPHPALVIGTAPFLSLPRSDMETVIVEKEHSPAYKMQRRPFVDLRTFAEFYAEERGGKLILADLKLRTETLYKRDERSFAELVPLKFRSLSEARGIFVDMKEDNKNPVSGKTAFTPIGKDLRALLHRATESGERVFLFVSRRGLHPVTICNDCGSVVLCERCKAPLVLHRVDSSRSTAEVKNIFMCHSCRRETASRDRCEGCGSWRLAPLGAGAGVTEETVRAEFPSLRVLRLDKETGASRAKAEALADEFVKTPGCVLVGTEFAISLLPRVPHIAVVSCDAVFVIPAFRINERGFAMLLALRAKAEKTFLLQTRMPHLPVFKESMRGDIANFYREELRVRKEFGYPPFRTLVKLSVSGTEEKARAEAARIAELLVAWHPVVFPSRDSMAQKGGGTTLRILVKVTNRWPNEELLKILMALPPSVDVRVDPEDTL